jgi:hypothetical protein
MPGTTAEPCEDLERHTILGEGNFGQVWLVSECLPDSSRRPYALKIQAKSFGKGRRTDWERRRKEYNDEDAPSLHYQTFQTYQDEHFVYMLLMFSSELFSVMHPGDLCCLPEAQVVLRHGYCRCAYHMHAASTCFEI